MTSRVAAIDCGTNSIRLLVADIDDAGALTELDRRMEIVRLGQGVDRTGELHPDALERTLAATRQYAEAIESLGATKVRFVATSATRDARNRDEFFSGVREILGTDVEVISGDEEAALSFRGATSAVARTHPGPYLVVDLGGGSTELVLGTDRVEAAHSMDVGSVRMTERHLAPPAAAAGALPAGGTTTGTTPAGATAATGGAAAVVGTPPTGAPSADAPPAPDEVAAARADVRAALDDAARTVPLGKARTLVGLAGSITTVTAHALGLTAYDRDRVSGAELPVGTVLASCEALLASSRRERTAMGFLHPGRVDVIAAGALVWSEVIERVARDVAAAGGTLTDVVTSEHDILDGIALTLA
ncbi:exopolyphosphatase [Myceligenerans xiligouense]|uniref:Exopolyphosphatase/guanosine-5'-triphosphate, 3'-diphosphate pyrophosphatase n=1 Tax=Myceligenerans xiligouense TaxID=253184 RepID=A0A3N4ZGL1_9MICO|nr:exopolyphosphatase [Myceligenerans xiligouense]RPF19985.1 exopolyphosphatase/guanosine-5'-triphosphate,3'-diphosphate pyrophosphatase [Myceligenerans xiligouense]